MEIVLKRRSDHLYRIVKFEHAVQIFEKKELYFAHPSSWEDPFETRVKHREANQVFGLCWCTRSVSDAMWRIYSPDRVGIRIATSSRLLQKSIGSQLSIMGLQYRSGDVKYYSESHLTKKVNQIRNASRMEAGSHHPTDALFMKREAFDHESEFRTLVIDPSLSLDQKKAGITIKVDPHELITNILIDPRAPVEIVDAFTYYFEKKLQFKGRIRRSVLYKVPAPVDFDAP